MPSEEERTRSQTTNPAPERLVATPVTPDQRHNRPEPNKPIEGLRVLYG